MIPITDNVVKTGGEDGNVKPTFMMTCEYLLLDMYENKQSTLSLILSYHLLICKITLLISCRFLGVIGHHEDEFPVEKLNDR